MKKISVFLISFLMVFSLFANELSLEKVCENLAKKPNTVGEFNQTKTIKSNGRKLKSTGKFIISNLGIVWKTEKPFGSCVVFTEDKMIQISNKGKVSVMNGKDNLIFENISTTMIAVFSGHTETLKKNFSVKFTEEGKNNWTLELTPNDKTIRDVMNKLILKGVSISNDISLDSLEMVESSGNTIKYTFSNQKYPKELSSDEKEYYTAY